MKKKAKHKCPYKKGIRWSLSSKPRRACMEPGGFGRGPKVGLIDKSLEAAFATKTKDLRIGFNG